jgi:hypothetical protein
MRDGEAKAHAISAAAGLAGLILTELLIGWSSGAVAENFGKQCAV